MKPSFKLELVKTENGSLLLQGSCPGETLEYYDVEGGKATSISFAPWNQTLTYFPNVQHAKYDASADDTIQTLGRKSKPVEPIEIESEQNQKLATVAVRLAGRIQDLFFAYPDIFSREGALHNTSELAKVRGDMNAINNIANLEYRAED